MAVERLLKRFINHQNNEYPYFTRSTQHFRPKSHLQKSILKNKYHFKKLKNLLRFRKKCINFVKIARIMQAHARV